MHFQEILRFLVVLIFAIIMSTIFTVIDDFIIPYFKKRKEKKGNERK